MLPLQTLSHPGSKILLRKSRSQELPDPSSSTGPNPWSGSTPSASDLPTLSCKVDREEVEVWWLWLGDGEALKQPPGLLYGGRRHVDGQRSALSPYPPASAPLLSAFLFLPICCSLTSSLLLSTLFIISTLFYFCSSRWRIPQSRLWSVFSIMVCPTGRRRRVIAGILRMERMERWSPGQSSRKGQHKEVKLSVYDTDRSRGPTPGLGNLSYFIEDMPHGPLKAMTSASRVFLWNSVLL